jgi:uncharacterized membrane protein YdjX (TVP38/TMEM64 family)
MGKAKSTFRDSRANYLRILVGAAIVFVSVVIARRYQLPTCSEIQSSMDAGGVGRVVLFGVVYALATVFFVPGVFLTLIGGLMFGPWLGTLIVSVSSVSGALMAFLIGRYVASNVIESFLNRRAWFKGLHDGLQKGGLGFVLFVRLVPLFPFNALNYACGLLPIRLRDFFIGSVIGMLPATFAYVYLGATGCRLIETASVGNFSFLDMPQEVRTKLFLAMFFLSLLSVFPLLMRPLRKRWLLATKDPKLMGKESSLKSEENSAKGLDIKNDSHISESE